MDEPLFTIVSGSPTDEELAALVGVLVTRVRAEVPVDPAPTVSAWRRSALPGVTRSRSWRDSSIRL